jgi:ribosomal protein S27AE
MRCGYSHLKVDHGKRFSTGKAYIIAWKASGTMPKND